jgi:hypothetical protein
MTPTREQITDALSKVQQWKLEEATDAILALFEPPKPPPRRLLVEITQQKDEQHHMGAITFADGIRLSVSTHRESELHPCMDVRELPPMPSMEDLKRIYRDHKGCHYESMWAVLAACGLEPPK